MRRTYFDNSGATEALQRRSLRGGAVSMAAQAINICVQVVSIIVLARLLLPEDFGLVTMVIAIIGFATIFVDLGTRDALAQRHSITEGEVSALFWITFAMGLIFSLVAVMSAGAIARLYGEPRLERIAVALSLTFMLPALVFQQQALMRRALMFRLLAAIDVGSNLVATAATIYLAYAGYAYWALVARPIVAAAIVAVCIWATCGWRPGVPSFTTNVRDLLRFGLNVTGFTLTDYIARSMDRVAIGYISGPRDLGYYQNALVVYENPLSLFVTPLHTVATATLSRLRGDLDELKRSWSNALSALTYFAAPAFAVLAVTGHDLVVVVLGGRWADAGLILSVLALRGPAHVVERTLGWLHIAAGRPDRWRRWGFVNLVAMAVALFCGLPFGAVGVASAYVIVTYLLFLPAITYAGRPVGIAASDVAKATGPAIAAALGIAAFGFLLRYTVLSETTPLVRVLLLSASCGVAYLAIMTLGFRMTKPLITAKSLFRRYRSAE